MLSASIKISNIDYDKTFRQIFPSVKEKINSMESDNMIIRLIQKLDDAALYVFSDLMNRLSETTKNEILVQCINAYSIRIKDKLNEELTKNIYGKHITVGRLFAAEDSNELYLCIDRIKVNYKTLVKDRLRGGLVSIADHVPMEKLEKIGLELLWTDKSKEKIIAVTKDILDRHGFVTELDDIQLMHDKEKNEDTVETEVPLVLTDKVEEDILNALAGYLKDKTENRL